MNLILPSDYISTRIADVLRRRVFLAPLDLRTQIFGGKSPFHRVFESDEYLYVVVGTRSDIRNAERREKERGSPFPGINFEVDAKRAGIRLVSSRMVQIINGRVAGYSSAISLGPD